MTCGLLLGSVIRVVTSRGGYGTHLIPTTALPGRVATSRGGGGRRSSPVRIATSRGGGALVVRQHPEVAVVDGKTNGSHKLIPTTALRVVQQHPEVAVVDGETNGSHKLIPTTALPVRVATSRGGY
ncbi:hypothetical protein G9A89_000551, partial [Geosiphon pyriformis]